MIFKYWFFEREIIWFRVNCIQWLNGNLHKLASCLHYLVNFPADFIDNGAPPTRNSKALYAINFIIIIESSLGNLHGLSDISTDRMFCINYCPRVLLKDEYWLGTPPKLIKELFKRNLISNLWMFIDLAKSIVNLFLILNNTTSFLLLFKRVEVVWKLQSADSRIKTLSQLLIKLARTIQKRFQIHAYFLFALLWF